MKVKAKTNRCQESVSTKDRSGVQNNRSTKPGSRAYFEDKKVGILRK